MEKCTFCGHPMVDEQVTIAFPSGGVKEFTQKECSNDSCDHAYIPVKEDLRIRVKQLEAERDAARVQAEELAKALEDIAGEEIHNGSGEVKKYNNLLTDSMRHVATEALEAYRRTRG